MFKDPIVGAAMPLGAAPGGGYTTYTEREYVWGPDYVDECLWQVTRPGGVLHTLQDASKDVVALLDETGAVARQYTYDPYGQVIADESFGSSAHNRLGHHGLFYDRLDVDAPAMEMAVGARGLYHNRNRTYDPRTGRFTTSDPNGTGVALLAAGVMGESGGTLSGLGSLNPLDLYGDGMSLYAYAESSPGTHVDPLGLFVGDAVGTYAEVGFSAGMLAYMLSSEASANMEHDLRWAMDWDMPDDWHTRLDASWVGEIYALVDINGTVNNTLNPLPFDLAGGSFGSFVPGSKAVRHLYRGGQLILGSARHHAFFRIYSRFKEGVSEIIVLMPKGLHKKYHRHVNQAMKKLVPDAPSIYHPGGQQVWQLWLERAPDGMDRLIQALKIATVQFEKKHGIKGLLEAIEAALP